MNLETFKSSYQGIPEACPLLLSGVAILEPTDIISNINFR